MEPTHCNPQEPTHCNPYQLMEPTYCNPYQLMEPTMECDPPSITFTSQIRGQQRHPQPHLPTMSESTLSRPLQPSSFSPTTTRLRNDIHGHEEEDNYVNDDDTNDEVCPMTDEEEANVKFMKMMPKKHRYVQHEDDITVYLRFRPSDVIKSPLKNALMPVSGIHFYINLYVLRARTSPPKVMYDSIKSSAIPSLCQSIIITPEQLHINDFILVKFPKIELNWHAQMVGSTCSFGNLCICASISPRKFRDLIGESVELMRTDEFRILQKPMSAAIKNNPKFVNAKAKRDRAVLSMSIITPRVSLLRMHCMKISLTYIPIYTFILFLVCEGFCGDWGDEFRRLCVHEQRRRH